MASKDNYTVEQLERIRATLGSALGDKSAQALETLESRFSPAPELSEEDEKLLKLREKMENPTIDVNAIIATGRLDEMVAALDKTKAETGKQQRLVTAIVTHKDAKPPKLLEALGKVSEKRDLVEDLVSGIVAQKGVNPLIDALRFATISPTAYEALAKGIAEQGTVNHLIRTIAASPRGQHDAELLWAMEIMRKGTVEQMLEAMNLLDDASPGIVALASGVANRKDVGVEQMVRGLSFCKNNTKASAILALELTRMADINAVVVILEKYISDATDAGEILVVKLVHRAKFAKAREPLLIKASRFMRGSSMAGKILAMGIYETGDPDKIIQAYNRMSGHPPAQKVMAWGLFKKLGAMKAISLLGKAYFSMSAQQAEVDEILKEARQRYAWVLQEVLGEDPSATPEPETVRAPAAAEAPKK
ncbi:MAG: hypothetical protein H7837_13610 [Magnetococcus sp. MYC-9]